jgi:hypothetical protein
VRAGLSPPVGSNIDSSLSIPRKDLSTGSGLPVAAVFEDGATAEKADTELVNEARRRAAEKNFIFCCFCREIIVVGNNEKNKKDYDVCIDDRYFMSLLSLPSLATSFFSFHHPFFVFQQEHAEDHESACQTNQTSTWSSVLRFMVKHIYISYQCNDEFHQKGRK